MQSLAPLAIIPPSFFADGGAPWTHTMPKLDDQISTLQERLKQLKLRQQRVDARQRAIETMRERKAETRRQFVVGSVILAKVQEGVMDPMQLRDWLDQTLTRRDDRALFHLPPKDEPDAPAASGPAVGAPTAAAPPAGESPA
jgi:hypothetical protein